MTNTYVHNPTEVEAVQFTKDNFSEIVSIIEAAGLILTDSTSEEGNFIGFRDSNSELRDVRISDYLVKGVNGIVYPCTEAVFDVSYHLKS